MPSDGFGIDTWTFDETLCAFAPTDISYADEWDEEITRKPITFDVSSWYPTSMTATFEYDDSAFLLSKCVDCKYCFKARNGDFICKRATHNGKPERENCKYERKRK